MDRRERAVRALFAGGVCFVFGVGMASCGGDATGPAPAGAGGHATGGGSNSGGTDAGADAADGSGATDSGTDAQVSSLCGNKVVDPGEQCDDGNSDNTDGCTDACRFTCSRDGECTDNIFCDGVELCSVKDHKCQPAASPLPDGTICGDASICQNGICILAPQKCGDHLIESPEECDPPDGTSCGPDCRFVCVSTDATRNCASKDGCSSSTCDDTTHACSTPVPALNFSDCVPKQPGKHCIDGVCSLCGNGKLDPGEECDDGNRIAGDGCEYNCKYSCKATDPTRNCSATEICDADGTCLATHRCSPVQPATAGKSCGSGKNCIAGNCVPIVCGDGVAALGVESCDDGNLANADGCTNQCTFSCVNAAADCQGVPSCAAASCVNDACSIGPNASADGKPCSTGGGSATCHGGACTAGVCGDPNVDAGEQCDLGAGKNLHGSGCEPTCVFSCQTNADCDDGDPCDGVETCTAITGGKKCTSTPPMNDGDVCAASPRRICLKKNGREGCVLSVCGDGYTDGTNGGTEECDPPNTVGCDQACKGKTPCNVGGHWGMKVTVDVSWGGGTTSLEAHSGQIVQWVFLDLAPVGTSTQFTASNVRVCGITIPDFQGAASVGHEWYGIQFTDNTIWDKTSMPTTTGTGRVSNLFAGATIDFDPTAILVGLTLNNPTGPWPDLQSIYTGTAGSFQDQDGDGERGLTLTVKTGSLPSTDTPLPGDGVATYRYPIVNAGSGSDPATDGRASKIYIGIRALSSETGTLDSCDSASGQANVSSIDNHIPGCYLAPCTATGCTSPGNTECSVNDFVVADTIKPVYAVSDATFSAKRLTGTAPNCATVRQALP